MANEIYVVGYMTFPDVRSRVKLEDLNKRDFNKFRKFATAEAFESICLNKKGCSDWQDRTANKKII